MRRVDRLVVWNDLMKQQAIELHGYEPDEIRVAGTPQWDLYFHDDIIVPRDDVLRRIGADPSRKLVTLTTTPLELYAHYDHVMRVMAAAIDSRPMAESRRCWCACIRATTSTATRSSRALPNVIIEKPFRPTVRAGDGMAVDITADTQRHLADTMRHSDVVVQVASTIAIEAAIFDTPVVNMSFDGETPDELVRSARRYTQFTHYVNITRHDAVRDAATPEAAGRARRPRISTDPSLERDGRRRVVAGAVPVSRRPRRRARRRLRRRRARRRHRHSGITDHVWHRWLRLAEAARRRRLSASRA